MPISHTPITALHDLQSTTPGGSLASLRAPALQHWLRRGLWLVLVCFALGTLAHSGHLHAAAKSIPTTHEQCDLCVGFGNTMSPPATELALSVPMAVDAVLVDITPVARSRRLIGLAQARAPPHSC